MPLYLVPVTLGDTPLSQVIPPHNLQILLSIQHFIVENPRSARRFLKLAHPSLHIDSLSFFHLDKHSLSLNLSRALAPLDHGSSIALLSDAGCPAIADPGALVIALAHQKGFQVIPLVGPSSILLALISSGLNGQSFAFHGYLPVNHQDRLHSLRHLNDLVLSSHQTQIFIETPYRNNSLASDILLACHPHTLLCIASSLTCHNESIRTLPISQWKLNGLPDLNRLPSIFLLGQ